MDRFGPSRPPKSMRPKTLGAFILHADYQLALRDHDLALREYTAQAEVLADAIEQISAAQADQLPDAIEHASAVAVSFRDMQARSAAEAKP